ncbi:MAG: oxygen-independent coproporphyrinogen III oxidase, partial [Bacillota bacterium]
AIDAMIMGLRMTRGVNVQEFEERFGIKPLTVFENAIKKSQEENLLEFESPWLRLTRPGYFLSNRVFVRIMESAV